MSISDFSGRERSDACPGALQVHEAADGPLARIRLPGGVISPAQLRELAACATELGSGAIELTSRANVQVRGLRAPAAFAGRMAAAGLLPSATHERVRNIVASPLGGRGHAGLLATRPLVEALDRELCARPRLAELPGRFLFAFDDGTGDVAGLGADVTLAAEHRTGARLLLAGSDSGLTTRPESAASLMISAAEAFLDERAAQAEARGATRADCDMSADGGTPASTGAWRIRELENGPARVAARLVDAVAGLGAPATSDSEVSPGFAMSPGFAVSPGFEVSPDFEVRRPRGLRRAGRHAQRDGRVALEALVPLGRLSAAQARALADVGDDVRLTPWRTVVVPDLSPADADRAAEALDAAGLVTDPDSPWAGVTACTGRPGCAKSLADVQADARRWVAGLDRATDTPVHWAGCARRCGLPRGRVVQMIATADGYREGRQ